MYLNKVYNWPMSPAPTNGESGDMVKNLSEKGNKVGHFWERRNLLDIIDILSVVAILSHFVMTMK